MKITARKFKDDAIIAAVDFFNAIFPADFEFDKISI
jgi:hypothetical protein